MKKLFYYSSLTWICLMGVSCKQSVNEVGYYPFLEVEEIVINKSNSTLLENIPTDIEFIILQDDDKRSFFKNIDKLIVNDSLIYLLDFVGTRKLFVYSIDGEFKNTIGQIGDGPNEYAMLTDFDIDNSGNVWIYDLPRKNLLKFDRQGNFSDRKDIPFSADGFSILDNGDFMFALHKEPNKCYQHPEMHQKQQLQYNTISNNTTTDLATIVQQRDKN